MILVGCDLPTRKQQVALLNTDTGELRDQELSHVGDDVERFCAALPPPLPSASKAPRYSLWFHALLQRLGHTLRGRQDPGDGGAENKTDRRDARHLRDLLKDDRFPVVWIPDPTTRDLRALIKHRLRLVRIRTMIQKWPARHRPESAAGFRPFAVVAPQAGPIQALVLLPHTRRRRDDSLDLLQWLNRHIDELDLPVATAAAADPDARRLMTHPGVGPMTALATVLVLGPVGRFPGSKHVVSYIGLAPTVNASADKCRLGHISKQGSALLRWVLGQAAPLATRGDAGLKRVYFAVLRRRGRPKARTVILVAAFCFLSYAYAMDPTIEVPASTFADRTTGAFTFTVNVINKGTTGSIDGYAKKTQNVLPQPSITPATRTIGTNQSATFTVTGTLKDPTIAGSVTVKFKYVDDDTSPPPVTVTGDVLITPGPPS